MKLLRIFFALVMLNLIANGSLIAQDVRITGVFLEPCEAEAFIFRSKGNTVEKLISFQSTTEGGKFGCIIRKEPGYSYTIQVQNYQVVNGRRRANGIVQVPALQGNSSSFAVDIFPSKIKLNSKEGVKTSAKEQFSELCKIDISGLRENMKDYLSLCEMKAGLPTVLTSVFPDAGLSVRAILFPVEAPQFYALYAENMHIRFWGSEASFTQPTIKKEQVAETGTTFNRIALHSNAPENILLDKWNQSMGTAFWWNAPGNNLPSITSDAALTSWVNHVEAKYTNFIQDKDTTSCSPSFIEQLPLMAAMEKDYSLLLAFDQNQKAQHVNMFRGKVRYYSNPAPVLQSFANKSFNDNNILGIPQFDQYLILLEKLTYSTAKAATPELKEPERMATILSLCHKPEIKKAVLNYFLDEIDWYDLNFLNSTLGIYNNLLQTSPLKEKLFTLTVQLEKDNAAMQHVFEQIKLKDSTGATIPLSNFNGKVIYIDIWANWCMPCKAQIPYLKKIEEQFHGNDAIVFLGVSTDKPSDEHKWKQVIREHHLEGNQLIDNNGALFSKPYGVTSIPRFMIRSKNGQWLRFRAPRPDDPETLLPLLKQAIAEN